jgi:hypothetical protein
VLLGIAAAWHRGIRCGPLLKTRWHVRHDGPVIAQAQCERSSGDSGGRAKHGTPHHHAIELGDDVLALGFVFLETGHFATVPTVKASKSALACRVVMGSWR